MSPLPFLNRRKRADDSEPASEPASDSRNADESRSVDETRSADQARNLDDVRSAEESVFELVPPPKEPGPAAEEEKSYKPYAPAGRNVHSIGITDLSRLSIDNDGRLYWDGKPVEVRRRISMSRAQVMGAIIVSAFVVIGAVGAAIHGSAVALDWACRMGWTVTYCGQPDPGPPPRPDIPA
jgi:hypothetical protein